MKKSSKTGSDSDPTSQDRNLSILGGSGAGKSYMFMRLVQQQLRRSERFSQGFSVIDPEGTLARYYRDLSESGEVGGAGMPDNEGLAEQ
jgi:hypothetical protein